MSKKKKQRKFQNFKNQRPISNKKPYQDDFLGKSVDLAPSVYEVFQEKNNSTDNQIILRPTQVAVLKSKLDQKPETKKLELQEVIDSFTQESSGDKKNIAKIFNEINEEKADFDAKLKTTETIFAHKDDKSMIFDRIYTKEFKKTNKPKTFFGNLVDILTSELVWNSVAISLVLGVILFYFQGLQPVILQNYIATSQKQVIKLSDRYSGQVSQYFVAQTKISEGYTYSPSQLCSQMKLYETGSQDAEQVNRLQIGLFADQRLKNLPNYQSFYDQDIKDEYQRYFLKYQTKLDRFTQPTKDLRDHVRFLNYRNNWIKNCVNIEKDQNNLATINSACVELKTLNQQFLNDPQPSFWGEIQKPIDSILTRCGEVSQATINNFVKEFFVDFDLIMFYKPDFNQLNIELTELNQDFLATDTQRMRQYMRNLEKERAEFLDSWYLLSFEI